MITAKMEKKYEISYKQELMRKGIHMLSLSIPVTYIFVTQEFALAVLVPLTLISISIDLMMKGDNPVREFMMKYFGPMLRPHEKTKDILLTGASWVFISAVYCVIVFPKIIMVTAFAILVVSDIAAALYGRKYGKIKFWDKSLEGTLAFIITASIIVGIIGVSLNLPETYFYAGLAGAVVGGIVEAASKKLDVDDNLSIPISIGMLMWIMGIIAASSGTPFLGLI